MLRRRQEAERERIEAYDASLRRASRPARPAPNFNNAIDEARLGFEGHVLRDARTWRPQMKSRDAARLRLAAARYLFARYPVAQHLKRIWLDHNGLEPDEIALRKRCYVVAAGGGSLYRDGVGAWLTRKEIHAFLNPPPRLDFEAATWQAIARSYSTDPVVVLRIARSKIARSPRAALDFWRDVARFFCAHPTTKHDMDDLCDYLADCRQRDPEYSLKGRTLASLGRQMREWHRDLAAIERIETVRRRAEAVRVRARRRAASVEATSCGSWPGAAIADWSLHPDAKDRSQRWVYLMIQLRTAADLVAETRAMHHCVDSYAAKCLAGRASIWSLRLRDAGTTKRLLTIEVDDQERAIQVRGFANRAPTTDEQRILERWAKARRIILG